MGGQSLLYPCKLLNHGHRSPLKQLLHPQIAIVSANNLPGTNGDFPSGTLQVWWVIKKQQKKKTNHSGVAL